ncbi:MAG: hypothetical protein ACLSAH_16760 [Bilophila wadsworthia]
MAFCVRCLRVTREAVDWAREFLRQVELPELVSRFASTLSTGRAGGKRVARADH